MNSALTRLTAATRIHVEAIAEQILGMELAWLHAEAMPSDAQASCSPSSGE
jgi:hypothetical protein